jgi:hypothetical protein
MSGGITRRQRHSCFEALELDPGAGAGPQQPVGRLTQTGSILRGVLRQGGIESCKKRRDVAVNPLAQRLIDKCANISRGMRLGDSPVRISIGGRAVRGSIPGLRFNGARPRNAGGCSGESVVDI